MRNILKMFTLVLVVALSLSIFSGCNLFGANEAEEENILGVYEFNYVKKYIKDEITDMTLEFDKETLSSMGINGTVEVLADGSFIISTTNANQPENDETINATYIQNASGLTVTLPTLEEGHEMEFFEGTLNVTIENGYLEYSKTTQTLDSETDEILTKNEYIYRYLKQNAA